MLATPSAVPAAVLVEARGSVCGTVQAEVLAEVGGKVRAKVVGSLRRHARPARRVAGSLVRRTRRLARGLARRLPPGAQVRVRRVRSRLRRLAGDVRLLVRRGATADVGYAPPPLGTAPVRLVVGPANFAGQGHAWTRAVLRARSDAAAACVAVERPLRFDCDVLVPVPVYRSHAWGAQMERYLRREATHVVIESMRPLMGIRYGEDCAEELHVLRRAGIRTALLAHGSDVRVPSEHARLYPWSPFRDDHSDLTVRLEAQARRFGAIMAGWDGGPRFVSTPDLVDFVPRATWLPTVVDVERWRTARPVLRHSRPVVLHVPSNARLKGTEYVEPVAHRLQDEGLIEYRRVEGVAPADMPALVAESDVVLEQFVLGLYSVAAIEAMAAGRVVLGHVHDRVRDRLPLQLPVVEADPESLERVLRDVVAERDRYAEVAAAGPGYAATVHDGRRSAEVLAAWLDG